MMYNHRYLVFLLLIRISNLHVLHATDNLVEWGSADDVFGYTIEENTKPKVQSTNSCSNGGKWRSGKCICIDGFQGKHCESKIKKKALLEDVKCPEDCSKNGQCIDGVCACNKKWSGKSCNKTCEDDCGSHGNCVHGICTCHKGYYGSDCSMKRCLGFFTDSAMECYGNGECLPSKGICKCNKNYGGKDCSLKLPDHCSDECKDPHGKCVVNDSEDKPWSVSCECNIGWKGDKCQDNYECPGNFEPGEDEKACSGHGRCKDSKCQCSEGNHWIGDDCSVLNCENGCSNHGVCLVDPDASHEGKCQCGRGFYGKDCSNVFDCDGGCGKNAVCVADGLCECEDGFRGDRCERKACRKNIVTGDVCGGNGTCNDSNGECECKPGFIGMNCDVECVHQCSNHGKCVGVPSDSEADVSLTPVCVCSPGYEGLDCSSQKRCDNHCSHHGRCFYGECVCDSGYTGTSCRERERNERESCDPSSCGGVCLHGLCVCSPGYEGDRCEKEVQCASNCNGNGECWAGKCYCNAGWTGGNCDHKLQCPEDCHGNGVCDTNGLCVCFPGYSGDYCSDFNSESLRRIEEFQQTSDCNCVDSNHGVCGVSNRCVCYPGYTGVTCEEIALKKDSCERGCDLSHGQCKFGKCWCVDGYSGVDCGESEYSCPVDERLQMCGGHGACERMATETRTSNNNNNNHNNNNFKCSCDDDWFGLDCSVHINNCVEESSSLVVGGSDRACSHRGICVEGECHCIPGFGGKFCSQITGNYPICPDKCSGHGTCALGKCLCDPQWHGASCDAFILEKCEADCNHNGECHYGKCFCNPGYSGAQCDQEIQCDQDCHGNGVCSLGRCLCSPFHTGPLCSIPLYTDGQSDSQFTDASLIAQTDASGGAKTNGFVDIESEIESECLYHCSHRGICFRGECLCEPGYSGKFCSIVSEPGSDKACRNKCKSGRCVLDRCVCDIGFYGDFCEYEEALPVCLDRCNDRGQCSHTGSCECEVGWTGRSCEERFGAPCDANCNDNGLCVEGVCTCAPGFAGKTCRGVLPVNTTENNNNNDNNNNNNNSDYKKINKHNSQKKLDKSELPSIIHARHPHKLKHQQSNNSLKSLSN